MATMHHDLNVAAYVHPPRLLNFTPTYFHLELAPFSHRTVYAQKSCRSLVAWKRKEKKGKNKYYLEFTVFYAFYKILYSVFHKSSIYLVILFILAVYRYFL